MRNSTYSGSTPHSESAVSYLLVNFVNENMSDVTELTIGGEAAQEDPRRAEEEPSCVAFHGVQHHLQEKG